ncbi:hypothetical protein D5086_030043 [Populus alba]|uniref:Uncharacterized protein n=1 Tax=Populus alba TaxID=43335 RepID=A0ACC4AME0_POPAL
MELWASISRMDFKCQLAIERTACYADEEMQGFVHACEQLFLITGQEFFLPILVKESSEQKELVAKLKLTLQQTCRRLTMFPEEPFPWKRGSKVSKNNDKIEPAPDRDGHMFIERADNKRRKANADDPSKCISFAKKHRMKENYMSDLLCCEKAFVPVFDNERRHFFLFVLQLKKQVVEIWDSLAASCQSDWVDRRLHNLFMLAPEELTNPDFMFDSENERLEVVLRLLASDVNSCRNDLASKAEACYEQRFGNH